MIRSLGVGFSVGIFTVALFFNLPCGVPAARAAAKPNIVMIMADDAGYNDVGFDSSLLTHVATTAETPNLDALAGQAVVMRQGYTSALLSTTARAGLLSGLSPSRYGVEENLPNTISNPFGLPGGVKILPSYLKDLGYETMAVGKWHEGYTAGVNLPTDKGFDGFYGYLGLSRSYYKEANAASLLRDGNTSIENVWQTQGDHSAYDPVKGRYLTDALGEKAVDYINQHAADVQPFFLYTAFAAPRSPYDVKQADYDHFSGIADTTQRSIAAMMLDMDRKIGDIKNALAANGIDNNTIFVFVNDTGAPSGLNYSPNNPYRGTKGFGYDGGIRIPYFIKAPGLQAGVYNSPVSTYDLLPTLVNAAGGDASSLTTDGVNILPYLSGAQQGDPHGELFWRARNVWAVRKGDWKLEHPDQNPVNFGLFNMASDPSETTNVIGSNQNNLKIAELYRDLTGWEATLKKPQYGALGVDDRNKFDHFVFRNNLAATSNWSAASTWQESGNPTHNVSMLADDAYANDVVEFTTRNDASYTANNDMTRMSLQTYMLNQVQLTGNFTGSAAQSGTAGGNPLLFVKDLSGHAPRIQLDATANATPASFTFSLNNELQLYNDLEIAGNGTQNFVIGGQIRDYYEPKDPTNTTPHNVTKSGTSSVTLTANNTFHGNFAIIAGQVHVNGPSAAISAATKIIIGSAGTLALDNGSISVLMIDNGLQGDYNHDHQVDAVDYTVWRDSLGRTGAGLAADGNGDGIVNQADYDLWTTSLNTTTGGALVVNGGLLKVVNIIGNLTNTGGTYSPGVSPTFSAIGGDLHENGGTLQIEIAGITAGTNFDQLHVGGAASLAGLLSVQLLSGFTPSLGQTFQFLTADGGISGAFSTLSLPALGAGKAWRLVYGAHALSLSIVAPGDVNPTGDYNRDGIVDAADYVLWRDTLGSTTKLAADGNNNGSIDTDDYNIWQAHFGEKSSGGSASSTAVPEPATLLLLLSAAPLVILFGRRPTGRRFGRARS